MYFFIHTLVSRARGTLTEGARALSKHYHRSEENWWGHNNVTEKEALLQRDVGVIDVFHLLRVLMLQKVGEHI